MKEVLEGMNHASNQLYEEAAVLRELAAAFSMTGNQSVSKQLHEVATNLQREAKELHGLGGVLVSNYIKQVDQASENMLMASLAGAAIAARGS